MEINVIKYNKKIYKLIVNNYIIILYKKKYRIVQNRRIVYFYKIKITIYIMHIINLYILIINYYFQLMFLTCTIEEVKLNSQYYRNTTQYIIVYYKNI